MEDEFSPRHVTYAHSTSVVDIVDDYEHTDPSLEYIVENVLSDPSENSDSIEFRNLEDVFNSVYTNNCDCSGTPCESQETCPHGGNYKIFEGESGAKELVLNENRPCKDLIYECFQYCHCILTCYNRLVQYGPRKNLKIVNIMYNGIQQKGLISVKFIPKGAFICEYAGEILTQSEAFKRLTKNKDENRMNYIICLNEFAKDSIEGKLQTFIDPSRKGNIGRYLNHSCIPNCEIFSVRIGSPVPRLGIFAKRDIAEMEELCFHYGGERNSILADTNDRVLCFCGHEDCEVYLPNLSF